MRTYPGMPMSTVTALMLARLRLLYWWNVAVTVLAAAALVVGISR
jgi:hypothetical protein